MISTEAGSAVLPRNWKDTWHVSVGAQFRPTEEWMLQAGFAYDSSPVDAADRTPDLPVDEQLRFTVGAEYAWARSQKYTRSFAGVEVSSL